jgi:plasmid stability protein
MASVLIKNLPDDHHQRLKQRAQRHHRSLDKELIAWREPWGWRRNDSPMP